MFGLATARTYKMKISKPTKAQVVSIIKNTLIAGLSAFLIVIESRGSIDKSALTAAGIAGMVAIIKTIEKLLTEEHLS